jgi:hypothetical protein
VRAGDLSEGIGLSPPVAGAVEHAVELVRELLEEFQNATTRKTG